MVFKSIPPLLNNRMKYWRLFAALVFAAVLLGIYQQTEHMDVAKRPIYGPKERGKYPEIIGPDHDFIPKGKYPDNGEFSSDTATKNDAYMQTFMFKPFMRSWDKVTGPPEPYLTDFANFHS